MLNIKEYGNFLKEHNLMELETNFTDQVDTIIFVDKEDEEGYQSCPHRIFLMGKLS